MHGDCLLCLLSGKSEDEVSIPIATLQSFKHYFELVVEHKNLNFKKAQQYYKTGLKVNMEKNLLSGVGVTLFTLIS